MLVTSAALLLCRTWRRCLNNNALPVRKHEKGVNLEGTEGGVWTWKLYLNDA